MTYSEKERSIYTAPTGDEFDPLAVQRKLRISSRGRINECIQQWQSEDQVEADVAEENLLAFARTAFGFKPFDESGPTDAVVLETLHHFLDYLKNSESVDATTPNSQPSTDCRR
jgi:hypothetical protein